MSFTSEHQHGKGRTPRFRAWATLLHEAPSVSSKECGHGGASNLYVGLLFAHRKPHHNSAILCVISTKPS